ncbi:MAG: transglutaminase-like domain-containing protein [Elainella sp. Prado103]|jgi:transglutaminase-like putative cysteine protease|nr:transglutaminase-like domain-containing protein [Elainella sp. Prado103]
MNWEAYLQASEVVDWQHPTLLQLAQQLRAQAMRQASQERRVTQTVIAQTCFEWVRDQICHSVDHQMNPVTWRASDVLKYKTGFCFAKSHLLAALLRANQIPTGFCYQRLSLDDQGEPYSLHGFNAVYLPEVGWYRIDARGNRIGIGAQFTPPIEQLAYAVQLPGEIDFPQIWSEPLPIVIEKLQTSQAWQAVLRHPPDWDPEATVALSDGSSVIRAQ